MKKLAIAVAAMLVAASAGAQMYRWVDKDGKVYYTDTPPPGAAKSVQKRGGPAAADAGSAAPYALQQAAKNAPVVVYTSPNCGQPCADGKALLAARGVPYREVPVGGDGMSNDEFKKATGATGVPALSVGKLTTPGYGAEAWHSALDAAGYPRSAPPLSAAAQKAAMAPAAPKADAPKAETAPAEPAKPLGPYAPN
jgi:glutaredoxin